MAETMRSLATIQTLLADNTTGQVSPVDLRDAIIATIQPGHGEIYVSTPSATTVAASSTWYEVAGTYTESSPIMNWDMTVSGRLYYTGAADRVCHIAASLSMTAAGSNDDTSWAVAKNGTVLTPSIIKRKIGSGSDVGSSAVHAFTSVTNGDYLSVFCRNDTSTNNLTAETLNLFVMDMAS